MIVPGERQSLSVHRDHRRSFAEHLYVYAVISRRSKGLSIGLNLNPDKLCNFDCIYCQVDRSTPGLTNVVDLPRLRVELEATLDAALSGAIWEMDQFRSTPPSLRRLNDIAFSGDGEPTTCPQFLEAVQLVATTKQNLVLGDVKLVLITNASMLHRPRIQESLDILRDNNGVIWAKLEAGTQAYFEQVDRTTIPLHRILENITTAAKHYPLVIQSMFLKMHGQGPPRSEVFTFCEHLNSIRSAGGQIQEVQVYTVARKPAESWVQPLPNCELDAIAAEIRTKTGLRAESFYGVPQ